MSFEFILWDNDGVLVDTEHLYFQATRTIFQSAGFQLTEPLFRHYFLKGGMGAWFLLEEKGIPREEIDKLREERNDLYSRLLEVEDTLIPGVTGALSQMSGRFRMGIVTSSRKEHFSIIHRRTGILHLFEFILTREDYIQSKPEPDPYLKGLKKTGLPCEKCLVVEDSERGLIAAKRAGLSCWMIPRGLSKGGDFSAADRVLDSIEEMAVLLLPS
ncbi:HAD family hydrolase [Acidobacteriota bacterium]